VRDRLFNKDKGKKKSKDKKSFEPPKARMRNFLSTSEHDSVDMDMMDESEEDRPIADLFPETTIMFADIAGFTAWSSVREPSQVFTLLEKIYGTCK
jgi:class 3 adenylate cyclase